MTVLLVEDEEQIQMLVSFLLEREGFEVHLARDGREASHAIETLEPPALVLLDVMLPYTDGYNLLREIRAKRAWDACPIVMLTAKSQEQHIVEALDAGANEYIMKPFQPSELKARVRRLVKLRA